jgi:hypothetical protein
MMGENQGKPMSLFRANEVFAREAGELAALARELEVVEARRARHSELIARYFSEKAHAGARFSSCACDIDGGNDEDERVPKSNERAVDPSDQSPAFGTRPRA